MSVSICNCAGSEEICMSAGNAIAGEWRNRCECRNKEKLRFLRERIDCVCGAAEIIK